MTENVILKPVVSLLLPVNFILGNVRALPTKNDLQTSYYIEQEECFRTVYQIYEKIYYYKMMVGRKSQEEYSLYTSIPYLLNYGFGVNVEHCAFHPREGVNLLEFKKYSKRKIVPDPNIISNIVIHFVLGYGENDNVFSENDLYWTYPVDRVFVPKRMKYFGELYYPSLEEKSIYLSNL